ncbi:MAG: hypothetical protein QM758_16370 [Armatimonas sp.]
MELTRLSELRPRTVWDVLDDAFDLYRERFTLLAGIAAVPFVPAHLLNALLTTLAYQRLQDSVGKEAEATNVFIPLLIFLGAYLIGQPILLIARAIQYAVTAVAIEDRLRGMEPSAKRAWKQVLPSILPITLATLGLVFLMAFVYAASCGVLIFLGLPFMALIPVCIGLEKRKLVDGFKRGWLITKYNFGRSLGLTTLIFLIEFALAFGLGVLVGLFFSLIPGQSSDPQSSKSFVWSEAAQAIAALFIAPLGGVASTLFYFDCRVRREGLDMAALAAETNVPLAEVPQ